MSNIIDEIEKKQVRKDLPHISVGDTVVVHKQIICFDTRTFLLIVYFNSNFLAYGCQ